ncbi:hypothetical protein L0152_05770 [bacterium]|nr:hypothetical protein [bacterium]
MKGISIFLLLLLFPAFSFAQYKVVLKSGKVIEGKFLHEDQLNVYIDSGGIKMNFKKDQLDLAKMKELNAKQETPAAESHTQSATPVKSGSAATAKSKKPARVYTSEDLQNMKEIWNEGATQTGPSTQTEPATEAQTQMAEAADAQPQSMPSLEPRDEETIRADIETTKAKIVDTQKQIQDLRAQGRVTQTWEKMVIKMQERLKDLDVELKEAVAARKAAKAAAQTQPQ